MITKNWKTQNIRCIWKKKTTKIHLKSHEKITISATKIREGGRTVGSGRVTTIIE